MPVHKLIQLWRIKYYAKNLHVCLIIITMTFQIYKNWGLSKQGNDLLFGTFL